MRQIKLLAPEDIPLVAPGDDIAAIVTQSLKRNSIALLPTDVVVIAQKVISKAEGRFVDLAEVTPSPRAIELATRADKDPRIVELILQESSCVLRVRTGVIIVEHRQGFVHANAGIDQSNIPNEDSRQQVLLLPQDCDASAERLRESFGSLIGSKPGVIINDSAGRAWRNGSTGLCLGCAGIRALWSRNGESDLYGRMLRATEIAIADELAAAASLLQGEGAESTPVVIIRGGDFSGERQDGKALLRDRKLDLFR